METLLDFSLQLEVFANILWQQPIVQDYLTRTYRHLIYDNVEEDGPRAHDILREWLPFFDSALLIYDEGAGFRYFLGADVQTGWALRELCQGQVVLQESFVVSEEIAQLGNSLSRAILPDFNSFLFPLSTDSGKMKEENDTSGAFSIIQSRFYPELLDSVVHEIHALLSTSPISPAEIVILAPYLSDALCFSITTATNPCPA